MTYDLSAFDQQVAAAKEWLVREFGGIRTGRATPAILDGVSVSVYGSLMPIKQTANISVEDARTLRVMPWDHTLVKEIERAIAASNLGLGTVADSSGLRVTFPELTGERRIQLIKIAKQKLEDARTTLRVARDDARKDVQKAEGEGGMGEDEKFRILEDIQKKTDAGNSELDALFTKKETEMNA